MDQENSSQDLNLPNSEKVNQLKKKLAVQKKLFLGLILIASILISIYAIFNIRLMNPPMPGGFG